ncbi:MAG: GMC oxidoreductase [Vulcanococcus sp.]
MNSTPDAIVVGSGATGGVAALALAQAGLQVLVLEAGPELSAPRAFSSEPLNSLKRVARLSAGRQAIAAQHPGYWKANPELYVDEVDNPYSTPADRPFLWSRGRQVGGKSLTWGGITLRLSDFEFGAGERDGHGPSWPIRHADLDPWYSQLETLLQVHGQRDGLPQLPDGCYQAPLPLTPGELHLQRCIGRDLDLPLIPSRGFRLRNPAEGPWPRSCSQGGALAAALATGRVRLQSQAVVSHVLVDPRTGRASGVEWVEASAGRGRGQRRQERAALVVLCASTIESLRLLLHSQQVGGLEEVSGLLGQGLMDHISASSFFALPPQPAAGATELSGAGSCFIPNTVNLGNGASGEASTDFLRGYGLWCGVQRFDPPAPLKRQRQAAVGFLIGHGEVLSQPHNRVALHPEGRDAWGIPIAHIDCHWGENERRLVEHMQARMRAVVASAGGTIQPLEELFVLPVLEPLVRNSVALAPGAAPPGYYIHELGGAPMGSSEATGVLNRWNQLWRTPNLLVTDGSCWPSAGWQSPTLTEMALTWRACDHAARALKRGEL